MLRLTIVIALISFTFLSMRHVNEKGEPVPPSTYLTETALNECQIEYNTPGAKFDQRILEQKAFNTQENVSVFFDHTNDADLDDFEYVKTIFNHKELPISISYEIPESVLTSLSQIQTDQKGNNTNCVLKSTGLRYRTDRPFDELFDELIALDKFLLARRNDKLVCLGQNVVEITTINQGIKEKTAILGNRLIVLNDEAHEFTIGPDCTLTGHKQFKLSLDSAILKTVLTNDKIILLTADSFHILNGSFKEILRERSATINQGDWVDFEIAGKFAYLVSTKGVKVFDLEEKKYLNFFFKHTFLQSVITSYNKNIDKTSISFLIKSDASVNEFMIEFFQTTNGTLEFNKSIHKETDMTVADFSTHKDNVYLLTTENNVLILRNGIYYILRQQLYKLTVDNEEKFNKITVTDDAIYLISVNSIVKVTDLGYDGEHMNCSFNQEGNYSMVFRMLGETCENKTDKDGYCVKNVIVELKIENEYKRNVMSFILLAAAALLLVLVIGAILCLGLRHRKKMTQVSKLPDASMDKSIEQGNKVIELQV